MNSAIISGLNHYIDLDEERASGLSQINGKVIKITFKELNHQIVFAVQKLTVQEILEPHEEHDVEIIASVSVLPNFMLGLDKDNLLKSGDIEIKGDAHVASVFQNTMREIEVDWEELLSKITGDAIAHHVGKGVKELQLIGRKMKENLRLDTRDYLQDNIQVAATKDEVDGFVEDVDTIRAQTDRLEARINRLLPNLNHS